MNWRRTRVTSRPLRCIYPNRGINTNVNHGREKWDSLSSSPTPTFPWELKVSLALGLLNPGPSNRVVVDSQACGFTSPWGSSQLWSHSMSRVIFTPEVSHGQAVLRFMNIIFTNLIDMFVGQHGLASLVTKILSEGYVAGEISDLISLDFMTSFALLPLSGEPKSLTGYSFPYICIFSCKSWNLI